MNNFFLSLESLQKGLLILLFQIFSYRFIYKRQKHKDSSFFFKIPRIKYLDNIPYQPWTFSIYVSWFAYMVFIFYFFDRQNHERLFFSFVLNYLFHTVIYIYFPTYYPNHNQDYFSQLKKRQEDQVSGWWHNYFYKQYIRPKSAGIAVAPSAHTSVSWVPVFFSFFYEKSSNYQILYCVWGVSIMLSTLTTKQHYFFDFFLGCLVGSLSVFLILFYPLNVLKIVCLLLLIFIILSDFFFKKKHDFSLLENN